MGRFTSTYVIEIVFTPLGLVPSERNAEVVDAGFSWNYTTWLHLVFPVVAAALLTRFVRTGGWPMLKMMGGSPDQQHEHEHAEDAGRADGALRGRTRARTGT
jgi:hypothetical protein